MCAYPQQRADSWETELKVLKDHWELQYDRVAGSLEGRQKLILVQTDQKNRRKKYDQLT